jgi:uncharacterized protein YciU (UPF0263 family)
MGLQNIFEETNPDLVVDQTVGSAYDVVRQVASNLDPIKHVSANLAQVYRVASSIDAVDAVAAHLDTLVDPELWAVDPTGRLTGTVPDSVKTAIAAAGDLAALQAALAGLFA